ncbi:MAG: response regulator transcription factor [Bacteroidetes bacterium]|nr:response regulator transcription factor [Bacteroidota bacterium]
MRILIADDHSVVRHGLERILLKEFPSAHIEHVADGDELLKKATQEKWDIIISDVSMPGKTGLEVIQQIKEQHPKLPMLMLSVHPEEHYAIRALKAGASGYLNKDMAPEELIKAARSVLLGKRYITPSLAEKLADQLGSNTSTLPHETLSDREFEVFKLLASGKSIQEIAALLFISSSTVSTYRSRILEKMGLKTNVDLTMYAIANKLL